MKFNIIVGHTDVEIFKKISLENENIEIEKKDGVEISGEENYKNDNKLVTDKEIISLSEKEVETIEISTEIFQIENINKTLEYNVNRSLGVKERLRFVVTIKGKIIPISESWEKIGAYVKDEKNKNELNIISGEKYEEVAKQTRDSLEQKGLKENKLGVSTLSNSGIWQEMDFSKSIENINKIKDWVTCFKSIKEETKNNEEKISLDYRDVMVVIKVSDEQSLQYKFSNMYVAEYKEMISNIKGEGSYTLTLKQKLIDENTGKELENFKLVNTNDFTDKFTGFLNKIFTGETKV